MRMLRDLLVGWALGAVVSLLTALFAPRGPSVEQVMRMPELNRQIPMVPAQP